MDHLISMISAYAGDLGQRDRRIIELEIIIAGLKNKLEQRENAIVNIKQRVDEGYETYELNDY